MKDARPFVFAWLGMIREIHTRMPVILPEDQLDAWLSGEAGKEILVPYPADQMTVWPISLRELNSPKNHAPEILEPVVAQDSEPLSTNETLV